MSIKILIVEDSAFMRKVIKDIIEEIKGIEVVGIARNGLEALEKIPVLKPDLITLDIEMPKLNGIDTLKKIKESYDIPVIMLSSYSKEGSDITIEALEIGAIDFIEKPTSLDAEGLSKIRNEINLKTKDLQKSNKINKHNDISIIPKSSTKKKKVSCIVIGSSTGGPKALFNLISSLRENSKIPILITQHMPKGFTSSFAERLNTKCKLKVVEAENDMKIQGGMVYIAPGDWHMTIYKGTIKLNNHQKIHGVRPAVDYLFESASEEYKDKLIAVILTGMGKDGTAGLKKIKDQGGHTIAQSESTCVVYGMPGNAVANGVIDNILDLDEISSYINTYLKEGLYGRI